jgi:AbrB family looped-hinge helix DNA binding protein
MKTHTALVKIFSGGKVTLPKEIRDVMGLKDGDTVQITIARLEEES